MLIVVLFVVVCVLVLWALLRKLKQGGRSEESRYDRSGSFMDFDPGLDSDKVGDPDRPNAGMDSVLKQEYLNDLLKDRKD